MQSGSKWSNREASVVAQVFMQNGDKLKAWQAYRENFPASERTYDSFSSAFRPGRAVAVMIDKLESGQPILMEDDPLEQLEQNDDGSLSIVSPNARTLEDVREIYNLPADEWQCLYAKPKIWQVGAKNEITQQIEVEELYGIEAKFVPFEEIRQLRLLKDDLFAELERRPQATYKRSLPEGVLHSEDEIVAVVNVFDVHLQLLAWGKETGTDQNLESALVAFRTACTDLASQMAHHRVDRIVFPVGQDFFHTDKTVDGKGGVTTRGTQQDVDSRWHKAFRAGMLLLIEIFEEIFLPIAPMTIIVVPGNHDTEKSWMLGQALEMAFRTSPEVEFKSGPDTRKYFRWGKVLMGFTHGHNEKPLTLGNIMAQAVRKDWGETYWREWFLGHLHREMEINEEHGVVLRYMPAIAATDSWHYEKGYVQNIRGARAFLYSKTRGLRGVLAHVIPPDPRAINKM